MDELEIDPELHHTDRYLASLSARVQPDSRRYAQLRQELLRRHQELSAENTQRAAAKLWPRLTGLKRLTLVAPPALAGVLAIVVILFGLQVSGHRSPQSAEAARITQAIAHTAPSVTAWEVNLQQQRGDTAVSAQCRLQPGHLFVRGDKTYLFTRGRWYQLSIARTSSPCPAEVQWAFAVLPAHLAHNRFSILPNRLIQGQQTEGIRYSASQIGETITSTVWVNRTTGLVLRVERIVRRGNKTIERDVASYSYTRTQ